MAKAKYLTPEYKAERKAIDQAQAAGRWLVCREVVCLMPTRGIAPWQPADVAHDVSGTAILGPAHSRCNRSEGATRGNGQREPGNLRFKSGPCVDCGTRCYGERCRPCRSKHTAAKRQARADEQVKRAWILRSADVPLFEEPRTRPCADCGKAVVYKTRPLLRCAPCAAVAAKVAARDYRRERRRKHGKGRCIACGAPRWGKKWCAACYAAGGVSQPLTV